MRLAHFSDIHVTVPPLSVPAELRQFKCLLGFANHYVAGRGRHFRGVEARIARLLEDVEGLAPDHALCTGDLTAMGLDAELARAAALFGGRLARPERWTVLPGNHDRYTRAGVEARHFERWFGPVCTAGAPFPHVKRFAPGVTAVLVDPSRPRLIDSSGELGAPQRRRLLEILTDASLAREYVILAIHYGLVRASGRRDRRVHRLRDDRALLALLARPEVHLDLVLHGHVHRAYRVEVAGRVAFCAGSATDLACAPPGYNVYDIDLERRTLALERRVWDPVSARYLGTSRTSRTR